MPELAKLRNSGSQAEAAEPFQSFKGREGVAGCEEIQNYLSLILRASHFFVSFWVDHGEVRWSDTCMSRVIVVLSCYGVEKYPSIGASRAKPLSSKSTPSSTPNASASNRRLGFVATPRLRSTRDRAEGCSETIPPRSLSRSPFETRRSRSFVGLIFLAPPFLRGLLFRGGFPPASRC